MGSKAAERRRSERELFPEENSLNMPEYNGFYTPERLVRMRSPVRIWPAAPKKPDSFENQAFLRLFCFEIWSAFFPDPPADPREGKSAEISPGERFRLPPFPGRFRLYTAIQLFQPGYSFEMITLADGFFSKCIVAHSFAVNNAHRTITLPMVSAALTCIGLEVWAKG